MFGEDAYPDIWKKAAALLQSVHDFGGGARNNVKPFGEFPQPQLAVAPEHAQRP